MKKLSRRDFLRIGALTAAGTALAGCCPAEPESSLEKATEIVVVTAESDEEVVVQVVAPTHEPTAQPGSDYEDKTVIVMYPEREFPQDYRGEVESMYHVTIERLEENPQRRQAMAAAGSPVDVWRQDAVGVGQDVVRSQLLHLDDYVDVSDVITWDGMYNAYKKFLFEGPEVGSGKLYGIIKDWSPDMFAYAYADAFEEAEVEVPSWEAPITWQTMVDLVSETVQREGDSTLRWGIAHDFWVGDGVCPNTAFLLDVIPMMKGGNLAENQLYPEGMYEMNLADNPLAQELFQFVFDLAEAQVSPSPIDPLADRWQQSFLDGAISVVCTGFEYGAQIPESEVVGEKVVMLPAPTWSEDGPRRNSCVRGNATVIHARTAEKGNADAAWKITEYYSAMRPAEDRAKSGQGVPILKSMFELLPQDTAYEKQRFQVLQDELPYADDFLRFNPFFGTMPQDAVAYVESALNEESTLLEAMQAIEDVANEAIRYEIKHLNYSAATPGTRKNAKS